MKWSWIILVSLWMLPGTLSAKNLTKKGFVTQSFKSSSKKSFNSQSKRRIKRKKKNLKQLVKNFDKTGTVRKVYPAAGQTQKNIEKIIYSIVAQLDSAKTVRDWINKAPKKERLFRRRYFSQFMSEKIPKFSYTKNQILLHTRGKKKAADVFKIIQGQKGLEMYFNGRNMTGKKGETLFQWRKRVRSKKVVRLLHFFVTPAYALPSREWAEVISSMAIRGINWFDYSFPGGEFEVSGMRFFSHVLDAQKHYGLKCVGNREASFKHKLANIEFDILASPGHGPNKGKESLAFLNPSQKGIKPFKIFHNLNTRKVNNSSFALESDSIDGGAAWGEEFLPNLSGILSGQPKKGFPKDVARHPEDEHKYGMYNNAIAYKACNLLAANKIKACSDKVKATDLIDCIAEQVVGAHLPGRAKKRKTLKPLSREGALFFKAQMAEILNPGVMLHPRGNYYPTIWGNNHFDNAVLEPMEFNTPGLGHERLRQKLQTDLTLKDSRFFSKIPLEIAFNDCVDEISKGQINEKNCRKYYELHPEDKKQDALNALGSLKRAFGNYLRNSGQAKTDISTLASEIEETNVASTDCRNRFNGPKQNSLLNYYKGIDQSRHQKAGLVSHVDSVVGVADLGRACCQNNKCQQLLNGTLDPKEVERIRSQF